MPFPAILLFGNTGLVVLVLLALVFLLRAGSRHEYYYGVSEIQEPLRRRIMLLILFIIALALIALAFNFLAPIVLE